MPAPENAVSKVVVHPLVVLSVVDHFTRMSKIGNQKRVVGVLLGCQRGKGVLDVSNSFAGESKIHVCRQCLQITRAFVFFQFHLMKMKRTNLSGFLTMTTLKICMLCSRKLMVSELQSNINDCFF